MRILALSWQGKEWWTSAKGYDALQIHHGALERHSQIPLLLVSNMLPRGPLEQELHRQYPNCARLSHSEAHDEGDREERWGCSGSLPEDMRLVDGSDIAVRHSSLVVGRKRGILESSLWKLQMLWQG